MSYKFIAFHTMMRGSGKPQYIVGCAKTLAERGAKVIVVDGLMYEQGAIPHQFCEILGASPELPTDGKNLYDLIRDYQYLCAGKDKPAKNLAKEVEQTLTFPTVKKYRNKVFPDVISRATTIPGYETISYLTGNNGNVVEVKTRVDYYDLFRSHCGQEFFEYLREELSGEYDYILLNAPAGHQEISGILCGHVADVIMAIDVDSPAIEDDIAFNTSTQLAIQVKADGLRPVDVKSVKGQDLEEVVAMIL